MTVANYRGFENLKEVECSGNTLPNEVIFMSLTLYRKIDSLKEDKLVFMETSTGSYSCHTFTQYSSCLNDDGDKRNSVVKTLVSDLEGGQRATIGCNVTAFFKNVIGDKKIFDGNLTYIEKVSVTLVKKKKPNDADCPDIGNLDLCNHSSF